MDRPSPGRDTKETAVDTAFPLLAEVFKMLDEHESTKPYANAARAAAWLYLKHVDLTDRKIRAEMKRGPRPVPVIDPKTASLAYRETLAALEKISGQQTRQKHR